MCNVHEDPSGDPLSNITLSISKLKGLADLINNEGNESKEITPDACIGISLILKGIADEIEKCQEQLETERLGDRSE